MYISGVYCIQKQTMKRPPGTSFVIGGTCFSFSNLAVSAVVFHFSEVLFTLSSLPKQGKTKQHMGVSKNSGTPKWMVYNGKPY